MSLTKYPLNANLGSISQVSFLATDENTIWLICGTTLTQQDYTLQAAPQKQQLTITADAEWQPPLRTVNYHYRAPRSPLDVSRYVKRVPISADDRVIINRDGHFAYAKNPDRALRFFCSADSMRFGTPRRLYCRGEIDQYVKDLIVHGYNMIRIHVNRALMYGSGAEAEFNTVALDNLDWLIHLCRQNGIYIMMNLMENPFGFFPAPYDAWGNAQSLDPDGKAMDIRFGLYFSPIARLNWEKGVTRLLTRINPYTQTALKDDPAFLLPLGFNEQEYAFHYRPLSPANQALAVKPYREFLRKRYGEITYYNKKNRTSFKSFDEIPCFTIKEKNADVNDFLYDISSELLAWYQATLRKIGYNGSFSNYDFVKSLTYHFIRQRADYVAMHVYHDHPLGNLTGQGGYNKQISAIGSGNTFVRSLFGTRIYRKPLVCSEYDMPFWNQYRYERSFVLGAYAAFQNIDAITVWAEPVQRDNLAINHPWVGGTMMPFSSNRDPLSGASELLTFFMYIRGDITPSDKSVRIVADKDIAFQQDPNSAPALEQTALSLLTGYSQQNVFARDQITPPAANEILLPSQGGGRMRIEGLFTETEGQTANIAGYVKMLKTKGHLTPDNRSDGESIYENATRELYLDAANKFMTVNTLRLQGICGPAGSVCSLSDFDVLSHDKNGNLTLTSIDGMKSIYEADRLLLVRLTNALNSNMRFTDRDMCWLEALGGTPALLQNSRFTVKIHNRHALQLKLYPLSLEGLRSGKVILPQQVEKETATFSVDTTKDGNTVYFEVSTRW